MVLCSMIVTFVFKVHPHLSPHYHLATEKVVCQCFTRQCPATCDETGYTHILIRPALHPPPTYLLTATHQGMLSRGTKQRAEQSDTTFSQLSDTPINEIPRRKILDKYCRLKIRDSKILSSLWMSVRATIDIVPS